MGSDRPEAEDMSLLDGLDNQTAVHEPYTGKDGFNKPQYDPPRTIKVRKEPARGTQRTASGDDVQVETNYWSKEYVKLPDRIDGHVVKRAREQYDLDGHLDHYEFAV
jgi:hypothetical protein